MCSAPLLAKNISDEVSLTTIFLYQNGNDRVCMMTMMIVQKVGPISTPHRIE